MAQRAWLPFDATDMAGASERVAHIAECLPEICTSIVVSVNFAEADWCDDKYPRHAYSPWQV